MAQWKNRIVGHGEVDPVALLAHPLNAKIHDGLQQQAMVGALEELGWLDEVKVNKRTGLIVDGHMRVTVALAYGQATVPVCWYDLAEDEERLALLTFDPLGALAGTDNERLRDLLSAADAESTGLQALLARMEKEVTRAGELAAGIPLAGAGGEDAAAPQEALLDQAVQLRPALEYVVVLCANDDEFGALQKVLGLGAVRRGGYRIGSPYGDQPGTQRVVRAAALLALLGGGDAHSDTE